MNTKSPAPALSRRLLQAAQDAGFDCAGIAPARIGDREQTRLAEFVRNGEYGDMDWMAGTLTRRRTPRAMWADARSILCVGLNYGPATNPLHRREIPELANISAYAWNRDYHALLKRRLKLLAETVATLTRGQVKIFVDTAPLLEKPLAQAAGIGWQGKHSNLVSRDFGSWLFLGEILCNMDLVPMATGTGNGNGGGDPDPAPTPGPAADGCGRCRRCLDICPTNAFPAPYRLDARRCISYLTIEHKGPIPHEFRPLIGNRIYGCDDCLAVCPWNKFAQRAREAGLHARGDVADAMLADMLQLGEAGFRDFFSASPVKRIGRARFLRNVLIAVGNGGDRALVPRVEALLADASPLIRGAAVWALMQLLPPATLAPLRRRRLAGEADASVRAEWHPRGDSIGSIIA